MTILLLIASLRLLCHYGAFHEISSYPKRFQRLGDKRQQSVSLGACFLSVLGSLASEGKLLPRSYVLFLISSYFLCTSYTIHLFSNPHFSLSRIFLNQLMTFVLYFIFIFCSMPPFLQAFQFLSVSYYFILFYNICN